MNDEAKFPAPALARGIRVLQALNEADGSLTLEELSQVVGYPKASLLRLLETLSILGLVQRDEAGKRYSALAGISYHDHQAYIRGIVRSEMEELTLATGITSEWYEPGKEFMKLIDLVDPPNAAVRISARVGFRRQLDDELEAVTAMALANDVTEYRETSYWVYGPDGEKVPFAASDRDRYLETVKAAQLTVDRNWNRNGIRRYATALIHSGELVGVLALAETFTPGADNRIDANLERLRLAAKTIEKEIGN